jgi:hypothetical protein
VAEDKPRRKLRDSMEPSAAIDVDLLADQVTQLASSQHLRVVPATPVSTAGSCHLVLLSPEDLSAAEFCELAATAGARLLYVQAEGFDAGADPDPDVWRQHSRGLDRAAKNQLAELRRDALHFSGRIRQLELAFAIGGVLHCWAVVADWYDSLVNRMAALHLGDRATSQEAVYEKATS